MFSDEDREALKYIAESEYGRILENIAGEFPDKDVGACLSRLLVDGLIRRDWINVSETDSSRQANPGIPTFLVTDAGRALLG
jgi:hypothetical protein